MTIGLEIYWSSSHARFEVKDVASGRTVWADDVTLSAGHDCKFAFLPCGLSTDTYVSLIEADGPQLGVRLPSSGAIWSDVLTLGQQPIQLAAASLIAPDPKVQVGWGSGTAELVSLRWSGREWSVEGANATPSATDPNVWITTDVSEFRVYNDSQTDGSAVVLGVEELSSAIGTILGHGELASSSSAPVVAQAQTNTTTYSVNLYSPYVAPTASINQIAVES